MPQNKTLNTDNLNNLINPKITNGNRKLIQQIKIMEVNINKLVDNIDQEYLILILNSLTLSLKIVGKQINNQNKIPTNININKTKINNIKVNSTHSLINPN